jgi:hypothetical protein
MIKTKTYDFSATLDLKHSFIVNIILPLQTKLETLFINQY